MAHEMWWKLVVICIIVIECESDCPNVKTELSGIRKRRHLTFPEGANFVMTISVVKAFMTHAPSGWNLVLEIDVLFPLPGANFTNAEYRRKLHHRQKREFWERLENALEYHNFNGQACLLRSICEARHYLAPPGKSLVHDLLRVIFTERIEEFVQPLLSTFINLAYLMQYGTSFQQDPKLLMGGGMVGVYPLCAVVFLMVSKVARAVEEVVLSVRTPLSSLELPPNTRNLHINKRAPIQERGFVEEVGGRYQDLLDPHLCSKANDCPISLLQIVLALNKQKY